MAESLHDIWKGYKDACLKVGEKIPNPDMRKDVVKKMNEVLKTFGDGFGPTLDKFEKAQAEVAKLEKAKEEMHSLQTKLHGIIATYQATSTKVFKVDGKDTVTRQLQKFKEEIDKRMPG